MPSAQSREAAVKVTYGQLLGQVALGGNYDSALRLWMRTFSKAADSPVEDELRDAFETSLGTYLDAILAKAGGTNARSQVANRKSQIRAYRHAAHEKGLLHLSAKDKKDELAGVLQEAMDRAGTSHERMRREGYTSLWNWLMGRSLPSEATRRQAEGLETVLGLAAGAITAYIPPRRGDAKAMPSPWGSRIKELRMLAYALKQEELPERVWRSLQDLVAYKTDITTEGDLRRIEIWTSNSQGECETAAIVTSEILRFLGWLTLPPDAADPRMRGKGFRRADLSLAMYADKDLVKGFVEFKRVRSGGLSGEIKRIFQTCRMLSHPRMGFLPQQAARFLPDLAYLGPKAPRTPEEAAVWFAHQHQELGDLDRELRRFVTKLRDPMKELEHILDRPGPLDVVRKLVDDMNKVRTRLVPTAHARAAFEADLMLVVAMTAVPLREYNWRVMTLGHFQWSEDRRRLWVKVPKEEFKNRAELKSDYRIEVALWAVPYFRDYVDTWRLRLPGAKAGSPYFFVNHTLAENGTVGKDTLGSRVAEVTGRFVSRRMRFHWIRHVVATDYLKRHPQAYYVVASILNDTLQSVLDNYGHLRGGGLVFPLQRQSGRHF